MEALLSHRRTISASRTRRRVWRWYGNAAFLSLLILPISSTFYDLPYLQALLAIILMFICLYPTARYFARGESGVPVIAVLCLAYAVQFALPVFTAKPEIYLSGIDIVKDLEDRFVISALLLSILGVLALQFSHYTFQSGRAVRRLPTVDLHLNERKAVVYCIIVGALLPAILETRNLLSQEQSVQYSALFVLLQNQQLVVISILGWIVYSGRGAAWHKILLYGIVAVAIWRGLSSTYLEQAVAPIGILFLTRWLYGRRVSVLSIVAIALVVLFLSPVKASFRRVAWSSTGGEVSASGWSLDKPALWIEQATQYWSDTLSGERDIAEATSSATTRTDLIHQFAHIYSFTPEIIPYQYGGTYSYFAVAVIPRALWPDKPQAGGANNYFAVTYGIATEEAVKISTFGVSLIGEGYINFGTPGVIFIMALQGATLMLLQQVFGGPKSGAGAQAVFLAFFIFFLNGVGSSAEILYGNILQNLLVNCTLLLWVREKPSARRLAGARLPQSNAAHVG